MIAFMGHFRNRGAGGTPNHHVARLLTCIAVLLLNSCTTMKTAKHLESDVLELCRPGGRMVGMPGHADAERFVARRLEETGCVPYRGESFALPYRRDGQNFINFAGVIPGSDRTRAPLLIGAHYDSVIPHPCADDNGAAVAICLELARQVHALGRLERDLIVAIFDAEEPPYFQTDSMGSNRFGEDQLDKRGVHFALIYDLVGHDVPVPAFKDLVFVTGSESHPELPDIVEHSPLPRRLKRIATLNSYVGDMSDHGVFRKNDVPYLFFSCGRWQHYHQPTDTPDRLNYEKMARLTEHSMEVLQRADDAGFLPFIEPPDTVAMEARTFRKSLGLMYPLVLAKAGLTGLKDRDSITSLVQSILSLGL